MNRITHIIWAARLCVLVLLLLVLCGAFPDFDILIDLEEWLVNHFSTPLAVCFVTGLMAVFVLAADLRWLIRLAVAVCWLAAIFAPLPSWQLTTELALWLTIHTYDSFLTVFTGGLSVAALASPGLWRTVFTAGRAIPKPHQSVTAEPKEPWSAVPESEPEIPATEEAAKPEPWDIAPTVTIDTAISVAEPVVAPIFPPQTEETHTEQLPTPAKAEATVTIPAAKETAPPVAEPWDVAPTVAVDSIVPTGLPPVAEPATIVSPVESTDHLLATETRPEQVPALPPAPQPVAETVEEIRSEQLPPPALAETTIRTPQVKAEITPEPWDIPPTIAIESAVQTGIAAVTDASLPTTPAEAGTETLPVPPAETVLPLKPVQETIVASRIAPVDAETTIHIPPAKAEATPEPWDLAPTERTEAEADTNAPLAETIVPLLSTETRPEDVPALPPTPQPVAETVEEIRSEQIPTPGQAETDIHTPDATLSVQAEPWELSPTVQTDEPSRSEPAIAEAPTEDADSAVEDVQTEIAPAAADDTGTEEDGLTTDAVQTEAAAAPPDTVQADEEATPAQMPEEDDSSATVDAVETETLPDATAVADEEELTAAPVETDLPAPETIGDTPGQDFTAAFATIAAGNDSDALQVIAYDIEPLPEPTLQPDMPPPAPANYAHWDNQTHFQTWQAAWLWHDWEPRAEDPVGPPSTARFLRLEDHLEKGMIRQATPQKDGWMYAELPRQSLIDYAVACSERPKFLFPEERSWVSSRLRSLQGRDVPLHALTGYMPYNEVKLALYKILRSINSEAVATEVRTAMRKGLCDGVARRISGNTTYGYERIPRMMWRRLKIDWLGNVSGGGHRYSGLMVRFRDGYLDTPQEAEPPSAVEAYGAIDSYLREQDASAPRR